MNETAIWASGKGGFQVRLETHLAYWRNNKFLQDCGKRQESGMVYGLRVTV